MKRKAARNMLFPQPEKVLNGLCKRWPVMCMASPAAAAATPMIFCVESGPAVEATSSVGNKLKTCKTGAVSTVSAQSCDKRKDRLDVNKVAIARQFRSNDPHKKGTEKSALPV